MMAGLHEIEHTLEEAKHNADIKAFKLEKDIINAEREAEHLMDEVKKAAKEKAEKVSSDIHWRAAHARETIDEMVLETKVHF